MPTVLTFGDSNTYGQPPMSSATDSARFGPEIRWPCRAAAVLGPDWELIEEGLPARVTTGTHPTRGDYLDGLVGLKIALHSHGPIDVLTIMLGTNDMQWHHGASVEKTVAGMAALLYVAAEADIQARHGGFKTLLIAPPPVIHCAPFAAAFANGVEASRALIPAYKDLAKANDVAYFDASQVIEVSPEDGVHFDADAHQCLGQAVGERIAAGL